MTPNIKTILSHYESDSPGVLSHLARILNHGRLGGTGKVVILPVDQGFEHGPARSFAKNTEAYDPYYHFKLAIEAGCNAYAAPLGFLEAGAKTFAGEIPLILKLNNSDSLFSPSGPIPAVTSSIDAALRLGCSAIGFTIYPGSSHRKHMYEEFQKIAEDAKKAGLAVICWSYPRGEGLSKESETSIDVVSYAAQIAAQLGAHIIKVKPPSSRFHDSRIRDDIYKTIPTRSLDQRVAHVLQSCFEGKRIVIFSGGEAKSREEIIQEIKSIAKGGGYGSIIGRNAFQRPFKEAVQLLKEVMDIYKEVYDQSS